MSNKKQEGAISQKDFILPDDIDVIGVEWQENIDERIGRLNGELCLGVIKGKVNGRPEELKIFLKKRNGKPEEILEVRSIGAGNKGISFSDKIDRKTPLAAIQGIITEKFNSFIETKEVDKLTWLDEPVTSKNIPDISTLGLIDIGSQRVFIMLYKEGESNKLVVEESGPDGEVLFSRNIDPSITPERMRQIVEASFKVAEKKEISDKIVVETATETKEHINSQTEKFTAENKDAAASVETAKEKATSAKSEIDRVVISESTPLIDETDFSDPQDSDRFLSEEEIEDLIATKTKEHTNSQTGQFTQEHEDNPDSITADQETADSAKSEINEVVEGDGDHKILSPEEIDALIHHIEEQESSDAHREPDLVDYTEPKADEAGETDKGRPEDIIPKSASLKKERVISEEDKVPDQKQDLVSDLPPEQVKKTVDNIKVDEITEKKASELKNLISDINQSVRTANRDKKMEALKKAADILGSPKYAEAKIHRSKDEEDYLVPDALEDAVEHAEGKLRKIEIKLEINKLKALIEQINQSVQAADRDLKIAALQKATELLGNPKYAEAKIHRSKDEEDYLVPDAIEDAVKEAEDKIYELEDEMAGVEKPIKLKPKDEIPEDFIPKKPVDAPAPVEKPEEPERDWSKEIEQSQNQLNNARESWFKALKEKGHAFSKKRRLFIGKYKKDSQEDFDQLKASYEKAKLDLIKIELEKFQSEVVALTERECTEEELLNEYVRLLQKEELEIDNIADIGDKTRMDKFKQWWKKHSKARLIASGALLAGGMAMTFTGVGSGLGAVLFGGARGLMSGTGTFMGSEALMDKRSKRLGQKGLIDQAASIGLMGKKKADKSIDENIPHIKSFFNEKSLGELQSEMDRLRILGLDKGVGRGQAGRFGPEQTKVIKLLEEAYYSKIKQSFNTFKTKNIKDEGDETIVELKKKQLLLSDILSSDQAITQNGLVSAQNSSRIKAMTRHGIAAGLGLTVGLWSGARAAERAAGRGFQEAPADSTKVVDESAQTPESLGEQSGGIDINKLTETPTDATDTTQTAAQRIAETVPDTSQKMTETLIEVQKGDTVWSMAEEQLKQRIGQNTWEGLNESQQTYLIDAIKDKVVANPADYGLEGNVDALEVGSKVDFLKVFNNPDFLKDIQSQAAGLTQEQMQNIVDNNQAIATAARAGVHITSENVDSVASEVREYGTNFLDKQGNIHDWSFRGQPVEQLDNGSFILSETQEAIVADQLSNVLDHAGEPATAAAEQVADVAQQKLEQFIETGIGSYDSGLYNLAKEAGKLDQIFQHVLENNNPKEIESFVADFVKDQGFSDNKANIFLATLRSGEGVIDDTLLGGSEIKQASTNLLGDYINTFENMAVDSFEKIKDFKPNEWGVIKVGDQYALLQNQHSGWGIFGKDFYLIDSNGDGIVDQNITSSQTLQTIFDQKSLGVITEDITTTAGEHSGGPVLDQSPITEEPAIDRSILQDLESKPENFSADQAAEKAAEAFGELNDYTEVLDKFNNPGISFEDKITALKSVIQDGHKVDLGPYTFGRQGDQIFHMVSDNKGVPLTEELANQLNKWRKLAEAGISPEDLANSKDLGENLKNFAADYFSKQNWQERIAFLKEKCGDSSIDFDTDQGKITVAVSKSVYPGKVCYALEGQNPVPIDSLSAEEKFSDLIVKDKI